MRWLVVAGAVSMAAACKGPMAKIDALRDDLASDNAKAIVKVTEGYAPCPELPPVAISPGQPSPYDAGCLTAIASALGSKKGFVPSPPDQAAAATAALVLARDRRGDIFAHADVWLASVKGGKGAGTDALRLALARGMAERAPLVGRRIDEDTSARETMKAIGESVPGACPTYRLLGGGADPAAVRAELSADNSACVQRDLKRRDGMGARYGTGTFRALEGALALWREAERALRLGLGQASSQTRTTVEANLRIIEAATQKNETKKVVAAERQAAFEFMGDVHADAGVMLWRSDAGADGGAATGTADAGASP